MIEEFARRVNARLDELGMSQADLARATNMGRDNISSYCRGKTRPRPDSLARLARALKCESSDLWPREEGEGVDSDIRIEFGDEGMVRIQINVTLPARSAYEVIEMVRSMSEKR